MSRTVVLVAPAAGTVQVGALSTGYKISIWPSGPDVYQTMEVALCLPADDRLTIVAPEGSKVERGDVIARLTIR